MSQSLSASTRSASCPSPPLQLQRRAQRTLLAQLLDTESPFCPHPMWQEVADEPVTFRFGLEVLRWADLPGLVGELAARHGLEYRLISRDVGWLRAEYRFALTGRFGHLTHFAADLHSSLRDYHHSN